MTGLDSAAATRWWATPTGLLSLSAAVVYPPIVLGLLFGVALGGERDGSARRLGFDELLGHNVLTGVLTVAVGLVSFGVMTAAWSLAASFANGFELGVVVSVSGSGDLVAGMAHFPAETVSFVLFTAAGLTAATRAGARTLGLGVPPRSSWSAQVLTLTASGALLLVAAAALE